MKIIRRSLIGFVKAGEVFSTFLVLFALMNMFFHDGKWTWVEPNKTILTFEVFLYVLWFAGSMIHSYLTITKEKKE